MRKKSIFAGFLALVMCVSVLSTAALAAEPTDVVVDADAKTITVSTADEFQDLSEYSNGEGEVREYPRDFSGWTVEIAADLDMSNITGWKPFVDFRGSMNGATDNEGGMATISNLTVTAASNVGLCGNSANGKFSNLTIKDSSFTTTAYGTSNTYGGAFSAGGFTSSFENCHVVDTVVSASRFVGGITGSCYGDITNCTVSGSKTKISAQTTTFLVGQFYGDNVGGIIGLVGEGDTKISGCRVTDIEVTGYRQVGGIAGAAQYGNMIEDNFVTNCKISSTGTGVYGDTTPCAGGVVGQFAAASDNEKISVTGNTVSNTTVTQAYTGQSYVGWAVGDANSRLTESQYTISGNTYNGETDLNEVGYYPANPSETNPPVEG